MRTDLEFHVRFSAEDDQWVATCDRFSSLSWLDPTPTGALDGLQIALALEDLL